MAKLPATRDLFGPHNPISQLPNWLGPDAAGTLLTFFQRIDAETGHLLHDFTDPAWDTRFLGDLYQDLSEAARKKFALLQTPEFVEEFILDRTLDPALDEFGLASGQGTGISGQEETDSSSLTPDKLTADTSFKMIDPACGSGHFLLGAFPRILDRWQRKEPGTNTRVLVQRTLDAIHGVDVNPYAVAIARFRLLIEALKACDVAKLKNAPAFELRLACGDSLYHGRQTQKLLPGVETDESHYFKTEDEPTLKKFLRAGKYHCVVANPPYITPKDRKANETYRGLYSTCHRQYSLAVPFMQRIFELAVPGGYTGEITANSFMKREFGKKLIEAFLPTVDMTHVIDTSGAYIPGHGTPTVILFGRQRQPVAETIRTVMGIRGEPSTPDDAAHGLVWTAIVDQIDRPGSESEYVSAGDTERERFGTHPWSIGGGGAAELKERLDGGCKQQLGALTSEIGFVVITGEDNVLLLKTDVPKRHQLRQTRPLADGEVVRDWTAETDIVTLWPNDAHGERLPVSELHRHTDFLWAYRSSLKARKAFGIPVEEKGIPWWALREVYPTKLHTPLSIVFAFVATHNHFVLDRGGKVFKQSAPVIKLPADATEDDHLALLGLLNSSTGAFWLRQVCHDKGGGGIGGGIAAETWELFLEYTGTQLKQFPLPEGRPFDLAFRLDALAQNLADYAPGAVLAQWDARRISAISWPSTGACTPKPVRS